MTNNEPLAIKFWSQTEQQPHCYYKEGDDPIMLTADNGKSISYKMVPENNMCSYPEVIRKRGERLLLC